MKPIAAKPVNRGVETRYIAKEIQPGNDFYRYVNNGWLNTAKIPQGLSSIESFTALRLSTEKQVAAIIKDTVDHNAKPGMPEQHIADFYTSFLNIPRRNQLGFEMLKDELNGILATKNRSEIASRMARVCYNPLIEVSTSIDSRNPQRYIAVIIQSGLGLPDRDYYLINKEPYIGHRSAYLRYIEGVL